MSLDTDKMSHVDQGNLLNFDLSEFFGSEYLSFLESYEPHQASLTKPSVANPLRQ